MPQALIIYESHGEQKGYYLFYKSGETEERIAKEFGKFYQRCKIIEIKMEKENEIR